MNTRNLIRIAALSVVSLCVPWSGSAFAKTLAPVVPSSPVEPLRATRTLAGDIQVVNPPAATPAQAQPVVVPAGSQKVVHEDVEPSHNYMATVAVSALMGGVAGLLVGGAIYYLGDQTHPRNIGFWTAGGVLAGTAVGVAQVVVQEDRATRAVGYADPAPTYRLALVDARF